VKSTTSVSASGCNAAERISILDPLTDRSIAHREKRKLILDAAIRVFADQGYHGARVGDIAEHAGVAHGLLYHYFASKDDVLRSIFTENWGELIKRFRAVEDSHEPAPSKLEGIAKILLRTWRNDPALVTVMVREVARSQQLQDRVDEVREAFAIVQRVIEEGQERRELRPDVDARLASWVFYGGLEEVLTGWVLGQLPDSEDDVELAERTAIQLALRGLAISV
jgi:AcrR family transcriptional regulator